MRAPSTGAVLPLSVHRGTQARRHTRVCPTTIRAMNQRLDSLIAVAVLQGGVFSRQQALRADISADTLAANLTTRRWQRVYPGVFTLYTGPLPYDARVWSALLWAGVGAALCDSTALRDYGVTGLEDDTILHVCVDHHRKVVEPPGLMLHRRRRLDSFVHPVRRPRTVRLEDAALHRASRLDALSEGLGLLSDVCQQRLTSPHRLRDSLAQLPKLESRKALWAVLDDIAVGAQSFLEISYLRDVERRHGPPPPDRQATGVSLGQRLWRDGEYDEWGVILELDGRLGHGWAADQSRDRRRDLVAAGHGRVTLRHGYDDVIDRACEAAALVARVWQNRGWTGSPVACGCECELPRTLVRLNAETTAATG